MAVSTFDWERRAYENRRWRLFYGYQNQIMGLAELTATLPLRERRRMDLLLGSVGKSRTMAKSKLDHLCSRLSEEWSGERPDVDTAFNELKSALDKAQLLIALGNQKVR